MDSLGDYEHRECIETCVVIIIILYNVKGIENHMRSRGNIPKITTASTRSCCVAVRSAFCITAAPITHFIATN